MGSVGHCSFDRIAPFYPGIEFLVFGNALSRARNRALACITDKSKVLLLGEGNGRFLVEVLRRHPKVRITCVEPSAKMRAAQVKRLLQNFGEVPKNLTIVSERFQDWQPESTSSFDVIVAHYFLDLFSDSEINDVVSHVDRQAAPNGQICVAEFSEKSKSWTGFYSRALIRAMYWFFFLVSNLKTNRIPNWQQALANSGWSMQGGTNHLQDLVLSSTWSKQSGTTSAVNQ